jgi:SAM-dependent methyltransferase
VTPPEADETIAGAASPTRPAWDAVADSAEIGAGTALLDVGCGTGGFCELAAARGALVHGVDELPDRVERARARVPAGDFRVGLMENLPWADGAFDVVTGFNTFQYAFDVDLALAESCRVLRPAGRLAVCKWGRPRDNEFFAFLGRLGAAVGRLPAVDPVGAALDRLHGRDVARGDVPAVMEVAGDAALVTALESAGAAPADDWAQRIAEAAAPYRLTDGRYRFRNRLSYRVVQP